MDTKRDHVSAFEAKTHLSELLRETERGHSYIITRRGKPVARLVPEGSSQTNDTLQALEGFRRIRKQAKRPGKGKTASLRELIEEGRRI